MYRSSMNIKMRPFFTIDQFLFCPERLSSTWRISTRSDRDQPTTRVFAEQWLVQISCNARWHFLKINYFLLFIHIFVLSALWERGRWRCRGSTSTSSTSSSAATLWESFQTPGRLSTGEITVSSSKTVSCLLKNCVMLPQKIVSCFPQNHEAPVENLLRPGQKYFCASW